MKKTLLFIVFCLFSLACYADEKTENPKGYGDAAIAEVTSVYNGDTFRCNIKGFQPIIGDNITIKVKGISVPELNNKSKEIEELAYKAKEFTTKQLQSAKIVKLKDIQRGKYFRILADVEIDGESLGLLLVKNGYAKHYDEKRTNTPEQTVPNAQENRKKNEIDISEVAVILQKAIEDVQKKNTSFEKEQFLSSFARDIRKLLGKNRLTIKSTIQDVVSSNDHATVYIGHPKGLSDYLYKTNSGIWVTSGFGLPTDYFTKSIMKKGVVKGKELVLKCRANLDCHYKSKSFTKHNEYGKIVLQFHHDDVFLEIEIDKRYCMFLVEDRKFTVAYNKKPNPSRKPKSGIAPIIPIRLKDKGSK